MISFFNSTLSSTAGQTTLWQDIWDYIYYNVISPDPVYYPNLGLGKDAMPMVRLTIVGLLIGVLIASFAVIFDKRVLGAFVRKLLREECLSSESAKRLSDLGFASKHTIKNSLRRGTTLRSVVKCREEEEYYAKLAKEKEEYEQKRAEDPSLPEFIDVPYRVNADADHFYIPEEKKYTADIRFEKKGTSWITFVIALIVAVILFFVLIVSIPEILSLLDQLVGALKSAGPSGNIVT